MCVIYACKTALPPEEELSHGATTNDDGAGVAWLGEELNPKTQKPFKVVRFKKGLVDEKDVLKFIQDEKIPMPLAIHFRTASIGGKSDELCHPFPITKGVPLWTAGWGTQVLFHNGHMGKWEDWVLQLGLPSTEQFPEGEWSDSRALAWAVYLKGEGVIPFLSETSRVLMFSAHPYQPEGEKYSPATDHFNFYGNWIKKEGWSQSVDTFWRSAQGRFARKEYHSYSGVTFSRNIDAEDESNARIAELVEDDSLPGVKPVVIAPPLPPVRTNVWTLEELSTLIADIEEEQKHAEFAART